MSSRAESAIFFSTSSFDLKYFSSLLTYKDVQYHILKIWFISAWSQKPKALVWLLTCVMITEMTPISYHKEANGCIFFTGVYILLSSVVLISIWYLHYLRPLKYITPLLLCKKPLSELSFLLIYFLTIIKFISCIVFLLWRSLSTLTCFWIHVFLFKNKDPKRYIPLTIGVHLKWLYYIYLFYATPVCWQAQPLNPVFCCCFF